MVFFYTLNIQINFLYFIFSLFALSIIVTQFIEKSSIKIIVIYLLFQILFFYPSFSLLFSLLLKHFNLDQSNQIFFTFLVALYSSISCLSISQLIGPRIGRFTKDGRSMAIPGSNIIFIYFGSMIFIFSTISFFQEANPNWIQFTFSNLSLSIIGSSLSSIFMAKKIDHLILISSLFTFMIFTASCSLVHPFYIVFALTFLISFLNIYIQNKIEVKFLFDDPLFLIVPVIISLFSLIIISSLLNGFEILLIFILSSVYIWASNLIIIWLINKFSKLRYYPNQEEIGSDLYEIGYEAYTKIFKDF
jgi:Amt family ammonium transporter